MKSMFKFIASLACAVSLVACGGGGDDAPAAPVKPQPAFSKTDTVVGTGVEAIAGDLVTVHYTGWLHDPAASTKGFKGTQFETSTTATPFSFSLGKGQVIPGWDQGVLGMKAGGKRTLVIPAELAYGARASDKIPANSALVFDIEVLSIKR